MKRLFMLDWILRQKVFNRKKEEEIAAIEEAPKAENTYEKE